MTPKNLDRKQFLRLLINEVRVIEISEETDYPGANLLGGDPIILDWTSFGAQA